MLGTFLQILCGNSPCQLQEIEPYCEGASLAAGQPLVAIETPELLRETGLPCDLRFGIADERLQVIVQQSEGDGMVQPSFRIKRTELHNFAPRGWKLYTVDAEALQIDLAATHSRAIACLGNVHKVLRSYPGDDFLTECLSGESFAAHVRRNPTIGQHWWTPLRYNITELQQLAEDATGLRLPSIYPDKINPALLKFRHHGIAIEENWVIHFATCRVPNKKNRVKLDTLNTFCNITPYENFGEPCHYKNDTEYSRQLHRNRAVWILFHSEEWGHYNLITNNCEHLSRMCKVGRRESAQVKQGIAGTALAAASTFIPGGPIARALAAIGLPYLLNIVLKHRTLAASLPPTFEEI